MKTPPIFWGECTPKEILLFIVRPNNTEPNRQRYTWDVQTFSIPNELPNEILKELCASVLSWCEEITDTEKAAHFHTPNIKKRLPVLENLSTHSLKLPLQNQFDLIMTEALQYARIGEETSNPNQLEQAINLFVMAYEFSKKHELTNELFQAISCLGNARMNLAWLNGNDIELLNYSILNFEEVLKLAEQLESHSSNKQPLRKALAKNKVDTYNNLGIAYSTLASKLDNCILAEKAVGALKQGINLGREHCIDNLEIGFLKMNLGVALETLGRITNDKTILEQSIIESKKAIAIFRKDKTPQYWARCHNSLGLAQYELGRLSQDKDLLRSALLSFQEALNIWSLEQYPINYAGTLKNMGKTNYILGVLQQNRGVLIESKRVFEKTLSIYKQLNNYIQIESTQRFLNAVKKDLRNLAQTTLR